MDRVHGPGVHVLYFPSQINKSMEPVKHSFLAFPLCLIRKYGIDFHCFYFRFQTFGLALLVQMLFS